MNARSKASGRQHRPAETGDLGLRPRALRRGLTDVSPRRASLTHTRGDGGGGPPPSAQRLTVKFQAFLKAQGETRRQFGKRAGVGAYTLTRLFPKRSDRKREFFSRRTLQAICDATAGRLSWEDLAGLCRPYAPRKKRINKDVPQDAPPLTRKFETYLRSRDETRTQFAERLCVTAPWLSHVFPLNPNAVPRRLGIDAALRFCKGTGGYLTLADFHEAGLCPAVEEVIRHCGQPFSSEARPADPDSACVQ